MISPIFIYLYLLGKYFSRILTFFLLGIRSALRRLHTYICKLELFCPYSHDKTNVVIKFYASRAKFRADICKGLGAVAVKETERAKNVPKSMPV